MTNQVILKVSNRVYKVLVSKDDLKIAKFFLPESCELNINDFFKNI